MCRLLGVVAEKPYEFGLLLRDAPRSIAMLSNEHSDGWGLATHLAEPGSDWRVHRSTACACQDVDFDRLVPEARGRVLIAHVRKKSVGPVELRNTHPFLRGQWLFAHNGTIQDQSFLKAGTSRARRDELQGTTDSEVFFAWLLTRLDDAGVTAEPTAGPRVDAVLRSAMDEATGRPAFGSINFLLSNGSTLYAHRFGRDLSLLDRTGPGNCASPGALGCPVGDSVRRRCVAVASEPVTPERWETVAPGTLLRIDLGASPRVSTVV